MKHPAHIARFRAVAEGLTRHRAREANPHVRNARKLPSLPQLSRRVIQHPSVLAVDRLAEGLDHHIRHTASKVEALAVLLDLGHSIDPMAEAERRRAANAKPARPRAPAPAKERLKARHVLL